MGYEVILGRNDADRKRLGTKGCVLVGKHFVKMGHTSSLSNEIWLDVTRSHVVFVCGKRGGGKCLMGDTMITLADGSRTRIDELYAHDAKLLTLNSKLKIRPAEKQGFYKRQVRRILHITLRSGKKISLTPEHPLLTVRGWIQAQHLTIQDRIATPRTQPVFGTSTLSEEEVILLAYFIAEGHTKGPYIRFTNFDPQIIEEFTQTVNKYDSRARITELKHGQYAVVGADMRYDPSLVTRDERITSGSMRLHEKTRCEELLIMHGIMDCLAGDKRIPQEVFLLPKERLTLFLNRLFSCDGTLYQERTGRWRIQYASKSKQLIQDLQHLLSRFGILSTFREKQALQNKKKYLNYDLTVHSTSEFLEQIGFFGEKQARQHRAIKDLAHIRPNPNNDTIPQEIWDLYRPKNWAEIGRSMGYAHPKALRQSTQHAPSRQKLLQIAIQDQREDIRLLAESDIYWDVIAGITQEEGVFTVYDTTVPKTHNFVANDIIVHNSYTLGVIAEGVSDLPAEVSQNIAVLLIDTMGIYWTMKYPNEQDRELLEQWGLQPKGLDVQVFVPYGRFDQMVEEGIPADKPFAITPAELEPAEWGKLFELELTSPVAVLLERVAEELRERGSFSLDEFEQAISEQDFTKTTVSAAQNLIRSAKGWGLFSDAATPIKNIVSPGQVSVLDVSAYAAQGGGWNVRALVIGLLCQKLFAERMLARKQEEHQALEEELAFQPHKQRSDPIIWVIIDEAHEFLPREGKTPASDALITLLREGRQPGISLVLATQQPGKIHTDVMTQSDIILSHRITAKVDTDALGMLTQSYMRGALDQLLNELPRMKGAAIVLDDNNEKLYSMRVRPRRTWHGGSDPDALKNVEDF